MKAPSVIGWNTDSNNPEMPKRIRRITSHVGLSRYMDTLLETKHEISRIAAIPSPYAYSPTHTVYRTMDGLLVFIVETMHKRYDIFWVPASSKLSPVEIR